MRSNNFKFGITNLNDAALDLSWQYRMKYCLYGIIKSAYISDDLNKLISKFNNKIIYHAMSSVLNETSFCKGLPSISELFLFIENLLKTSLNRNQVVLNLGPIFPISCIKNINEILDIDYIERIRTFLKKAEEIGINRIEYHYLKITKDNIFKLKKFNSNFKTDFIIDYEQFIPIELMNDNLKITKYIDSCNDDLIALNLNEKYSFNSNVDLINNKIELVEREKRISLE